MFFTCTKPWICLGCTTARRYRGRCFTPIPLIPLHIEPQICLIGVGGLCHQDPLDLTQLQSFPWIDQIMLLGDEVT